MDYRARIGSMIHRNRANLAMAYEELDEIAKLLPHCSRAHRSQLRHMAGEARRDIWRARVIDLILRLLDSLARTRKRLTAGTATTSRRSFPRHRSEPRF
jgi:hypothetical protein